MKFVTEEGERHQHPVLSADTQCRGPGGGQLFHSRPAAPASLGAAVGCPGLRTKAPSSVSKPGARQVRSRPTRLQGKLPQPVSSERNTRPLVHIPLIREGGPCCSAKLPCTCSALMGRVPQGEPPTRPPACSVLGRRHLLTGSELARTFTGFAVPVPPSVHTAGGEPGHPFPGQAPR